MKDRIPGAPGQHLALIGADELVKMQEGKQFTITLTRDDKPTVEGTPYSKAAVLPDALAAELGLGEDATPADALEQLRAHRWEVDLPQAGWAGEAAPYTQTVALEGVRETDRPHYGVVYTGTVAQMLAEKEAFALVDDLDTASGSVTFTCFEEKPGTDLRIQLQVDR